MRATVQIESLALRNIRSFEEAYLELSPGTTLLVGDVGAGKTSLLYAIEMALFGVAEVDAGFLVRHGRSQAEVSVTLGDPEHRVEISRSFRRVRRRGRETFEPETITFSEDGRPTSYSATELRRRVIDLVGFPDNPNPKAHSDIWRWAIYVPQERMREILAADTEERLETVRKALGVERFRTAAENAASVASDLKVDARRRREEATRLAHWDDEWAKATRESDQLVLDRRRLEEDVARESSSLEERKGRLADLEREIAAVESDRRELENLRRDEVAEEQARGARARRASELRRELATAEEERARARLLAEGASQLTERLAAADRDLVRLEGELDGKESALRELAARRAELAALARTATERRERATRARTEQEATSRALAEALSEGPTHEPPAPTPRTVVELEAELATLRAEERLGLERLTRARADLAAVDELLRAGVCPTCHQPVQGAGFSTHQAEAQGAVTHAEADRSEVGRRLESVEAARKARERYDRARERWTEAERRRASLREGAARWEEELRLATTALEAEGARPTEERDLERRWEELTAEQRALRDTEQRLGAERGVITGELEKVARAEERLSALEQVVERTHGELGRLADDEAIHATRRAERAARATMLEPRVAGLEAVRARAHEVAEDGRRLEQRVASAREALVRSQTRLEALAERIALAERGRTERTSLLEQAQTLDARASWMADPLRYHLLAMEREILTHAQTSFDRAFSRYFAALVDDPAMVARTDAAFTPEVTINGEVTPAEALSGGERTSLALAFRLALASTVRSLGEVRLQTLLLDEPTDGFSSEQVVRMGELLEELALPQVIVVSHEAQLASIADRTVRVVKRDGRSSLEGTTERPGRRSLDAFEPVPSPGIGSDVPPPDVSRGAD